MLNKVLFKLQASGIVEVIIAVAILSVAIYGTLTFSVKSMQSMQDYENYNTGALLLEEMANRIQINHYNSNISNIPIPKPPPSGTDAFTTYRVGEGMPDISTSITEQDKGKCYDLHGTYACNDRDNDKDTRNRWLQILGVNNVAEWQRKVATMLRGEGRICPIRQSTALTGDIFMHVVPGRRIGEADCPVNSAFVTREFAQANMATIKNLIRTDPRLSAGDRARGHWELANGWSYYAEPDQIREGASASSFCRAQTPPCNVNFTDKGATAYAGGSSLPIVNDNSYLIGIYWQKKNRDPVAQYLRVAIPQYPINRTVNMDMERSVSHITLCEQGLKRVQCNFKLQVFDGGTFKGDFYNNNYRLWMRENDDENQPWRYFDSRLNASNRLGIVRNDSDTFLSGSQETKKFGSCDIRTSLSWEIGNTSQKSGSFERGGAKCSGFRFVSVTSNCRVIETQPCSSVNCAQSSICPAYMDMLGPTGRLP